MIVSDLSSENRLASFGGTILDIIVIIVQLATSKGSGTDCMLVRGLGLTVC